MEKKIKTGLFRSNRMIMGVLLCGLLIAGIWFAVVSNAPPPEPWVVDSQAVWEGSSGEVEGLRIEAGMVSPTGTSGIFRSKVQIFDDKREASEIVFRQSPTWLNWTAVDSIGPSNLGDAPVFLTLGEGNYWLFGRYRDSEESVGFAPAKAVLEGFDIPLKTTPFENQFDAPGGLKDGLGGYHAWQSRDLVHWVHHGPVTEDFSRWVTSAEHVNGTTYIYYDYPNDQDPHFYVDADLTDGLPGRNMGMAFEDPSDGSDCAIIRSRDGWFHLIYEDWSPINAGQHSWDSPLAGHAVSRDGISPFEIVGTAVDKRTLPTGAFKEYPHPHWLQHPDWDSNMARYEIHEPEQDAFGDWAAIRVGGQYYLFGDFHPAGGSKGEMSVAWFTASSIYEPFEFCASMGNGHPDPDIGFAEGQFYLVTQTKTDFVSPGPWVPTVEARVGVATGKDGEVDVWTHWQEVEEQYSHVSGYAKQVARTPASIDLHTLPPGYGFCFEFRVIDETENESRPELDKVTLFFD